VKGRHPEEEIFREEKKRVNGRCRGDASILLGQQAKDRQRKQWKRSASQDETEESYEMLKSEKTHARKRKKNPKAGRRAGKYQGSRVKSNRAKECAGHKGHDGKKDRSLKKLPRV